MVKSIVDVLNSLVWSRVLVFIILGAGFYFSVVTKFLQVRHFRHMISILLDNEDSDEGVSSFQALAISISGRVGTGNIAGVATAIALGGPGAVFWMWVTAFLGAATSFIESTLGQIYKDRFEGEYRGGPAYFIERGMNVKWYAVLFAVSTLVAMGLLLPSVQANSIAAGMQEAFSIPTLWTGIFLAVALAAIIFGGVKRIAKFAQVVVPIMAILYIIVALYVLIVNASQIPALIKMIFVQAFSPRPALGGIAGSMVMIGVKRGLYSNEAGQGTCPHAAAAAEVKHPAAQGLVQAFGVYIDTLFVCTATALMILITGMYNIENPAGGYLKESLPGVEIGPGYTQAAVDQAIPGFGSQFVAISLLFFAFTTILAYYYIAETNVAYIEEATGVVGWPMFLLKIFMLAATVFGAIRTAATAWAIADLGVGIMAWLNIIAIVILRKPALEALRDYESQLDSGVDVPVYDSSNLEVENANFWEGYSEKDIV